LAGYVRADVRRFLESTRRSAPTSTTRKSSEVPQDQESGIQTGIHESAPSRARIARKSLGKP
jgi:hypothetical protein